MPSVNFYFQVHQPYRLKKYNFFRIGKDHQYFDDVANSEIIKKVGRKCYIPTNKTLLKLIDKYKGKFRVSYSITGTAIEQMQEYCPESLKSFVELAETGCVEFLAETYYHTLSAIYDESEFRAQVIKHTQLIQKLFKQTPQIFRNTELIYSNEIGALVSNMGFKAMLAEGADDILQWRSPNYVYSSVPVGNSSPMKLLLKNYRLSDDIAFRFSNRSWPEFPLTANKFANWVHQISGSGEVVNLFMDYETFGEHQWESTGIFAFLDHLPEMILQHPDWNFLTPSEVVARYSAVAPLSFDRVVSWADIDRDLTAWLGNHSQKSSLRNIYDIGAKVRKKNNPMTTEIWRKLQTSDHFYYMCTKWFADGDVHAYFSPYKNPYEAFINYMNVFTDFQDHVLLQEAKKKVKTAHLKEIQQ